MKVYTIEIAEAIETEFKNFLKDWGGGAAMRFTRFVDLGGKQTDLYAYAGAAGAPPWLVVRIKSVFKSDQGECIQYFANLVGVGRNMEEVLVSPEIWKLPAVSAKVLDFARGEMMNRIAASGGALEAGDSSARTKESSAARAAADKQDEEDLEDIDTSGILASSDAPAMDFNPEEFFGSLNQEGKAEDDDEEGKSGFNPEDVIKD